MNKNWGLTLKIVAQLTREANQNLVAVTNRLRRMETEEMLDLAKVLRSPKNRREILRVN